jgi:hypothetical protein
LYFRYTLEIDPTREVALEDYVAAIATLLESLWSSGMDAVAACDFEEKLPRNVRRLKWARTAHSASDEPVRVETVGDTLVVVPVPSDPVALDACVRMIYRQWPEACFEEVVTGKKYRTYEAIPFGRVQELLAYPDARAEAAWDAGSPHLPPHSMLQLIPAPHFVPELLDDAKVATSWPILALIRSILRMDILNTYAEAA